MPPTMAAMLVFGPELEEEEVLGEEEEEEGFVGVEP